ncbi:MAG: tetratricopeptide repeat protein [Myxococcaceae bacterium]
MLPLRAVPTLLAVLVLLGSAPAAAQIEPPRPVDELAPDGPAPRPVRTRREPRPAPPPVASPVEDEAQDPQTAEPARPPPPPVRRPVRASASAAPAAPVPAAAAPTVPARDRTPPPALVVPTEGDDAILSTFHAWREAERARDPRASRTARDRLAELRETLAIADLESVSLALLRGARVRAAGKDGAGAVELAQSAVALSPESADAHWGLFRAHLGNDLFDLRRLWSDALGAARTALADPRWSRGLLGDLGATLLVAWLATALAALVVLFLRSAPSLVHDVHHAFPRGVARWQAGALLILVLLLPWAFRMGLLFPSLVLFAAVTLYLEPKERWLLAVLLAGACLVPPLAGALVQATTFAGTPAEDVLQLERGGLEAAGAATHVEARLSAGRATYSEVYALAHWEFRRGKLQGARAHADRALALRPGDARSQTLLGNVAFAETRWPEAIAAYIKASEADPTLPDPLWNVSRVYRRRARTLSDDAVGAELDRAQNAAAAAQRLDERLITRSDPPESRPVMNLTVLSPPLSRTEPPITDGLERRSRVSAQLAQSLVGNLEPGAALLLPLAGVVVLAGLGFVRGGKGVSQSCSKCGRAVCRRCDPELVEGGHLCHQCVNVYTRRGKVAPMAKVNKEMEVRHHQAWVSRWAYGLGLVWSGAGHLFTGVPVRGALHAFVFAFAIGVALNREGLLRTPGLSAGTLLWVVLALVLLAATWSSSLRHLAKERG